jgi:hypothetical protein
MFGPSNRGLRAKDRGWEGKISVVDPDPVWNSFLMDYTRVSNISSGADHSDHLRELGDEFTRSPAEGS